MLGSERSNAAGGRFVEVEEGTRGTGAWRGGYGCGCDEGAAPGECSDGDWEGGETEPEEEASLTDGDDPAVRSGTADGAGERTGRGAGAGGYAGVA